MNISCRDLLTNLISNGLVEVVYAHQQTVVHDLKALEDLPKITF